jgi:hypothetical protein
VPCPPLVPWERLPLAPLVVEPLIAPLVVEPLVAVPCEDAVVLLAVRSNGCNALKCMHFVHLKVAMRCDSIEPAMRCSGRCEKEGAMARVRDMYGRCHVVRSGASSITVSRVRLYFY